ncbi:MAG: 3-hydroxy-5-phosphonooxypentane-2,4-dione thiolase, partial [Nitrosopumilus sp.]|nr:3-hydroxy-5-phosphonooxypentane-2,4-dione thiolase [Nitrosopumilus sp.]
QNRRIMDWGLQNRISRIIKPQDNRALMLAVDHGYFLGPTEKLENPKKVIAPLLKYCDSLMVTRGVQRTSVPATSDTPMVLRVSGGSSIIGDDLSQEDITVSIEDAIRLNASALAMSIFVGSKYEYQTVVNLGKLVNEATKYGLPVLAVTAVGKELGKDARYLSLACRVAAEQGAHIVKTYYCDNFEKVVQSCPVPIIVAGGKKIPERDALQLTFNSIKAGAVGVDMGRNIWQSEHPVSMIKAVRGIVHGNLNVDQAFKLYQKLVSEEPKRNPNQNNSKKPNNQNQTKPNNPNQNNQNNSKKPNQNKPSNTNQNNSKKPNNPNQTKPNKQNKPNTQNKPNNPNQTKPNTKNNSKKPNNPNLTKPSKPNQNKPNPPKI